MNFLQLCQETDKILGTQGTISSVSSASGYQELLISYVSNAWADIQNLRKDWIFLKRYVNISLTAGKTSYSVFDTHLTSTDPVASWIIDRFINTTSDNNVLTYVDPFTWMNRDLTTQKQPGAFTVHENSSFGYLEFENPNQLYNIKAHYYAKPQVLVDATDTPSMPSEYHKLIAHYAASEIGYWLGNTEAGDLHATKADNLLGDLLRSQNPSKTITPRRFV